MNVEGGKQMGQWCNHVLHR